MIAMTVKVCQEHFSCRQTAAVLEWSALGYWSYACYFDCLCGIPIVDGAEPVSVKHMLYTAT